MTSLSILLLSQNKVSINLIYWPYIAILKKFHCMPIDIYEFPSHGKPLYLSLLPITMEEKVVIRAARICVDLLTFPYVQHNRGGGMNLRNR